MVFCAFPSVQASAVPQSRRLREGGREGGKDGGREGGREEYCVEKKGEGKKKRGREGGREDAYRSSRVAGLMRIFLFLTSLLAGEK